MSRRVLPVLLVLLAAVTVGASLPAGAGARPTNFAVADISDLGKINLFFFGPVGSHIAFYERVGSRRVPRGERDLRQYGGTVIYDATQWRCDRVGRRFEGTATAPGGKVDQYAYAVRTPSCRRRLAVSVPARRAVGARQRFPLTSGHGRPPTIGRRSNHPGVTVPRQTSPHTR